MRKLEERKRMKENGIKIPNSSLHSEDSNLSCSSLASSALTTEGQGQGSREESLVVAPPAVSPRREAFSIDTLLETPKVPRGRRPNSKYPRVQASKSMNPLAFGMFPPFPINQPVGFTVEQMPTPPGTPSPTDKSKLNPRQPCAAALGRPPQDEARINDVTGDKHVATEAEPIDYSLPPTSSSVVTKSRADNEPTAHAHMSGERRINLVFSDNQDEGSDEECIDVTIDSDHDNCNAAQVDLQTPRVCVDANV